MTRKPSADAQPQAAGPAADVVAEAASDPVDAHPVELRLRQEGTLATKVQRGVAWTAGSRVLLIAIQLGVQAVLARLLLPEDYGLVAIVSVVGTLSALLVNLGLTAAIIQNRHVTERLLSTAFWLNAAIGLAVAGTMLATAPLVAAFYDDDRLVPLLQVSALFFAVNVGAVPTALLQRALRFKQLSTADVSSAVLGLACTVAFAFAGLGAMSLTLGSVIGATAQVVIVLVMVRWVPRTWVHRAELAHLWRFGRSLTGAQLLGFASRNIDTVLLGRVVSAGDLGLYNRSYNIMMLPLTQVNNVLTRVLLPAYSQLQDDTARLTAAWVATVRTSLLFGVPIGIGVASAAPALVDVLYGDRWLGMVPTLVLLGASVPPQLVARNTGALYQSLGRTGLQFRTALVSSALTVAAVLIGLPWGITGVATALLIASGASMVVSVTPLMRLLHLSAMALWRASRGVLLAGAALAGAALGVAVLADGLPSGVVLLLQVAAAALAYGLVLWVVERTAIRQLLSSVRSRR